MSSTENRSVGAYQIEPKSESALGCLSGPGEACALARSLDWKRTSLGPVEGWSQALRSTASLVLHNHSPMLLWWGAEFVQIYNDAYRPVLGDKHPRAMGQKFSDCWREVFHILGPMAEQPFRGGPASVSDDVTVLIERKVPREETHFRLAYSPVPDESVEAGIGGVLATVTEISEQIFSERQMGTLRKLGALSSADMKTARQVCVNAAAVLGENLCDAPFALFYLIDEDGTQARRVASTGVSAQLLEVTGPAAIALAADHTEDQWCRRDVILNRHIRRVDEFCPSGGMCPQSPWGDGIRSAIVLPLAYADQTRAFGALICGLSPNRFMDAGYRSFFELVTSQIVTAIRDARALEEERKRAESLAAIDHAKTAFFSNVSHEFRTPLTLMLGPLEAVLAEPATPDAIHVQLDLAHRNALRLLRLVNTLLDFSQIEAGRARAAYEPTDLAELTRDLASAFQSAIETGGLTYSVECATLAEPVYVNRQMWEKIVLNLLSNAFKYTLRGNITVRLRGQAGHVLLEVADTGAGIPDHELPRIFERFHRIENAVSRTQEGTGIGLSLVRELVDLHRGEISVVSETGRGTTFRVLVRFGSAHLPADQIKEVPSESAALNAQAFVQEALRWTPSSFADAPQAPLDSACDVVSIAGRRYRHLPFDVRL
ncbi:HAMP domain-containing histidine kinase (plasmid) [Paraburkholderia sp. D15]|uniref:GAF domain-containing sensor histidine kinase n=1 Tax=Paraburkholderia sp. D15 TaxID=2880218 RepID=UPI00247A2519|nr:HAMP domain-containing sensor histidine kinase [Paraburkholderia sp. D15]WGS55254.1 HAMP domain-containing histidine kinase [Paraburkholderia sp. D15]